MLKRNPLSKKYIFTILLGIVGVSLLVVAGLGVWDYYSVTQTGVSTPSTEVVTETKTVSEKPVVVSELGYVVPANQPRVVEIPSLNIEGYVERVGIDKSGAMSTPSNINFAGWYVNNSVPGDKGVSIINGHAGGRYTKGIFKSIGSLKENDSIRVQMGDMSWREFSVVSTKTYPVGESAASLFADDPTIDNELHLITCDGVFDDKAQSYDLRTIVVAKYRR